MQSGHPNYKYMSLDTVKETSNRVYYYVFENGIKAPNVDDMVAYLIDGGVLFCGTGHDSDNNQCIALFININDHFYPGADCENITYDELPELYELVRSKKFDGVSEFVANRRGIPNVSWRNKT